MHIILALKILIKEIVFYSQFWGVYNALRIQLFPKLQSVFNKKDYVYLKNKQLTKLLKDEFAEIIAKYKNEKHPEPINITPETPIWVCWWQGETDMPEMIKQCYKLLLRNSNGHPINLITKYNYDKYIEIPDNILTLVNKKEVTITTLSDIIRMSLLAKHGGIWIDATYWVTKLIDFGNNKFFTIRQERFKGQGTISDFRWTPHCIGCGNPYYIFSFIKECFIHHLNLHNKIIEYLLIDYIINIAYEEFEDFKKIIDNLPNHEPHIYIMPWLFNQKFDEDTMKNIYATTPFLKLTYKQEYYRQTPSGEQTFYNYFIKLD